MLAFSSASLPSTHRSFKTTLSFFPKHGLHSRKMRSSVLLWLSGAVVSASAEPCIITEYAGIAAAVSTCSEITLRDIYAPENSSIDLSGALPGSVITFAGTTTFAFTNSSTFKPIVLGGSDITVTGEEGHIIDGNGQAYWDGLGSNGGVPK